MIIGLCPAFHGASILLNNITLKAQVTLCRSGGPDLYDRKNREHLHGRLMKSWQHRTDILEVCSVGKRSAVIGKPPVRQSCTAKLCRVGRDCGYDLFMDRFQSCVESETSWNCRTQREGIRGQRVVIRGQRMDGREDRINITIASCLIVVTFTFSYISRYICLCIYVYLLMIWLYSWVEGDSTLLIVLMRKSRGYNCGKWEWELKWYLRGIHKKGYWIWTIHRYWYWSVIMISFIYQFIWTNKMLYCRNIGLMIPDYHLSDIYRCRLRRSPRSGTWSWLWSVRSYR